MNKAGIPNQFFSSCRGNRVDTALVSRHKELQREVCDLTEAEEQLDKLISTCNLQFQLLAEDPQNKKYPFAETVVSCGCLIHFFVILLKLL